MVDILMYNAIDYIQITPSLDYNLWLKCLDTQLYEQTNQNIIKFPKVVEPMNKKALFKALGISVINQEGRGQWGVYCTSPQSCIIPWLNNFGDFC